MLLRITLASESHALYSFIFAKCTIYAFPGSSEVKINVL